MIALNMVLPLQQWQSPMDKRGLTLKSSWQRFVARFVGWLAEPIDFPGKWPETRADRKGYNRGERHFDERRSAQS